MSIYEERNSFGSSEKEKHPGTSYSTLFSFANMRSR